MIGSDTVTAVAAVASKIVIPEDSDASDSDSEDSDSEDEDDRKEKLQIALQQGNCQTEAERKLLAACGGRGAGGGQGGSGGAGVRIGSE